MIKSLLLTVLLCSSAFAGETTEIKKEVKVKTQQELLELLKVYMSEGYTSFVITEPWSYDKKEGWNFILISRKYIN